MYSDNEKKFYIILNRNHETATLFNAACHLTAGITDLIEQREFHHYPSSIDGISANMSHYPVVILQAKNSSQLSSLILKCREERVLFNFFTTTMLSYSAEQQIADTANSEYDQLDFVAVALYGETEQLKPLTKKFSVYR
ncbi:DUF2000 family protein [Serratia entomophila]|uniref:DUF2000 domain-containing protein n=1 Tax=Serratia entomophila TaxID=42906 RepID=A0ABY5CYP5_9GAMM|nr:DUF2000 family protein [Serratia entomophila]USV02812.1 DUF2000 domain-containing protein [Serratia entomophila]CAI0981072.1 Protein of uncharacterised function (DUF2000) [Serratia entomophila]CAI0990009.1 Protein of uncharacterised function (DUF2000) [Serratia entomophila]CAI1022800.1 Protein of uncharacterised function (DUF2000) [Serratia entomophila]CAI1166943.1 Protein of uncharacterised function (DUF2000) [Serratia entomophila]